LNTLAVAILLTGGITAAWSGALHLRSMSGFQATLIASRVVPSLAVPSVAWMVAMLEVIVGSSVALALWPSGQFGELPVQACGVALGSLFLLLTCYLLLHLRIAPPGSSCGCFASDEPVGKLTLLRAAGLALFSYGAAFAVSTPIANTEVLVALACAIPIGIILRNLPTLLSAQIP
jgi:hypothetical protein